VSTRLADDGHRTNTRRPVTATGPTRSKPVTNPDKPMTTTEAAKALGIPRSTLKNWLRELPVGAQRDAQGDWRISPEALDALNRVQQLRTEEGRSLTSIRVLIAPDPAEAEPVTSQAEPTTTSGQAAAEPVTNTGPAIDVAAIEDRVVQAVTVAVERQAGVAMELAKLAHTNGRLEAEVDHLRAQLAEAQAKLAQLETPRAEPAKKSWWPWS
jgi:excisionase family DNA binding protein